MTNDELDVVISKKKKQAALVFFETLNSKEPSIYFESITTEKSHRFISKVSQKLDYCLYSRTHTYTHGKKNDEW